MDFVKPLEEELVVVLVVLMPAEEELLEEVPEEALLEDSLEMEMLNPVLAEVLSTTSFLVPFLTIVSEIVAASSVSIVVLTLAL